MFFFLLFIKGTSSNRYQSERENFKLVLCLILLSAFNFNTSEVSIVLVHWDILKVYYTYIYIHYTIYVLVFYIEVSVYIYVCIYTIQSFSAKVLYFTPYIAIEQTVHIGFSCSLEYTRREGLNTQCVEIQYIYCSCHDIVSNFS